MDIYKILGFIVMILFIYFYLYMCITVFYIFYADDFSDLQIDVDTKLNYTYNHSYIISNAFQNAILQNI